MEGVKIMDLENEITAEEAKDIVENSYDAYKVEALGYLYRMIKSNSKQGVDHAFTYVTSEKVADYVGEILSNKGFHVMYSGNPIDRYKIDVSWEDEYPFIEEVPNPWWKFWRQSND